MCGTVPTNLHIDDALLKEALRLGGRGSKRETVNDALREYIERRKRRRLVEAFGTVEFDPSWDYKKLRGKR
jgi:Arc/MetJ family transcription regulator